MLPETNRTIYLKITLDRIQTLEYMGCTDENILIDIFDKTINDLNYQVIHNVTHES